MRHEIFQLCRLQLQSIMKETNEAVGSVTTSASDMLVSLQDLETSGAGETSVIGDMKANMGNIMRHLQFEDELTQRITHLIEILRLMESGFFPDESENEAEMQALAGKIHAIFSIRSEFEQLEKIFPHLAVSKEVDSIELF